MYENFSQACRKHLFGFSVAKSTDVEHQILTLEPTPNSVIDTLRRLPVPPKFNSDRFDAW